MLSMLQDLRAKFTREDGATAVEYGIMVALIAVVIIVAVAAIGNTLNENFEEVDTRLQDANPGDGTD